MGSKEKEWLVNSIKSAIESRVARSKFLNNRATTSTIIPALSPLILTSNGPPPSDSGYMRRIIDRIFGKSESHNENDKVAQEFKELLRTDLDRLGHYGDFRNWFIMNNQELFLQESRPLPLDLGYTILKEAYKKIGRNMPDWFNKTLSEGQLEDSLQDASVIVKRAFESYIGKRFQDSLQLFRMQESKYIEGEGLSQPPLPIDISGRFIKLAQNNLLPDVKHSPYRVIIRRGILEELYKLGVSKDQLPNLQTLADYMGGEFRKSYGNKVVDCGYATLATYFDRVDDKL